MINTLNKKLKLIAFPISISLKIKFITLHFMQKFFLFKISLEKKVFQRKKYKITFYIYCFKMSFVDRYGSWTDQ